MIRSLLSLQMRQRVYGDYVRLGSVSPDKHEIDAAITKILTSTDEKERRELYRYVLTHLHRGRGLSADFIRNQQSAFQC